MPTTCPSRLAPLVASLWLVVFALVALVAHAPSPAPSTLAGLFALAFLPYAPLALARRDLALHVVVPLVLVASLPLLVAPVSLSDDLYRYLWDARVTAHGLDPYAYAPSDPALASLRDLHHAHVNHADIPTIYPPGAQLLFLLAERIAHAPWSLRLLALVAHLAVGLLLRRRGPAGSSTAWLLNPLALSESALGGHVDVFVGLALLAAAFAFTDRRLARAVVFAAAATAVKLVGALLLPLALRDRRALALGVALAAVLVLPLAHAGYGSSTTGGFGHYARRWGGNAGLHLVVEHGVARGLDAAFGHEPGRIRLASARSWLTSLEGTRFDPHAAFTAEKKPIHDVAVFETHVAAALVTRALVAIFALALALWLGLRVHRGASPLHAARIIVLTALLLAPQIHPWYLLWLLPLELAAGRSATLVWSALALGAYAPLDGWWLDRVWQEPPAFGVIQHLVVLSIVVLESVAPRLVSHARRARSSESARAPSESSRELSPSEV